MEPAEADVGISTNTPPPSNHEDDAPPASVSLASAPPICPICCDEYSTLTTATVTLSACQHQSCGTCLVRWMEREETSGRCDVEGPTCPFCRVVIRECDVVRLMDRPFRPRMEETAGREEAYVGDEIDELTLHWINQNTTPCPFCGNRVEKSDGCDHMVCLCGYQFCYSCGGAYGRCRCVTPGNEIAFTPGNEIVYNGSFEEPLRDYEGRVDLRLCIRRREVRLVRSNRYEEGVAHWHYAAKKPSLCTFNGRWMFSSKNSSTCISMLRQQLENQKIMSERYSRYWAQDRVNYIQNATWLFLRRGADIKAMHQLYVRDDISEERNDHVSRYWAQDRVNYIHNATWLFLRRGADIKAMHQLYVREDISEERFDRKWDMRWEEMYWSDWEYWFGHGFEYKVVYDRLMTSLKFGMFTMDRRVQKKMKRFTIVLKRMEDALQSEVVNKTTVLWWDHRDHPGTRWTNELEEILHYESLILEYERSFCRCRLCRPSDYNDCVRASSQSCDSGFLMDGTPFDSAYLIMRKMTGSSRKKTSRGTARKSSKKLSRSERKSKMSPQTVARWKRKKTQLAWSKD
ncbi:hypothetical protein ACHAXA_003849 [Cyclostephanos tholiformis]|uniref:RING-type domain-containing protein n=1 Tax=Cyclostephanos tholiformis TaxID=382380 RepID=A0ABD3RDH9_9STRA